eukprot:5846613-Prymnesium_polylepis.1
MRTSFTHRVAVLLVLLACVALATTCQYGSKQGQWTEGWAEHRWVGALSCRHGTHASGRLFKCNLPDRSRTGVAWATDWQSAPVIALVVAMRSCLPPPQPACRCRRTHRCR